MEKRIAKESKWSNQGGITLLKGQSRSLVCNGLYAQMGGRRHSDDDVNQERRVRYGGAVGCPNHVHQCGAGEGRQTCTNPEQSWQGNRCVEAVEFGEFSGALDASFPGPFSSRFGPGCRQGFASNFGRGKMQGGLPSCTGTCQQTPGVPSCGEDLKTPQCGSAQLHLSLLTTLGRRNPRSSKVKVDI